MDTKHMMRPLLLAATLSMNAACSQQAHKADQSFASTDGDLAVVELRLAEAQNPGDWKIKRELGMAYFRTDQGLRAIQKLSEARKINSNDGPTLLFLGLSYEKESRYAEAVDAFRNYLNQAGAGERLRSELHARIRENLRKQLRTEVRESLVNFKNQKHLPIESGVAVLYFRNVSNWDELDPLLKGMHELISDDLRKLGKMQVVDRMKLQYLLEELQITPNEFFDRIQLANAGRLLGANYLVSGGIERSGQSEIQLNAGVVSTKTGRLIGAGAETGGQISQIVDLSKKLVWGIVRDLEIEITPSESQTISQSQTHSGVAFIAFSKGLDFEDKQMFAQARDQYIKALEQDPDFDLARIKLAELPAARLSIAEMERLVSIVGDPFTPRNAAQFAGLETNAQRPIQ